VLHENLSLGTGQAATADARIQNDASRRNSSIIVSSWVCAASRWISVSLDFLAQRGKLRLLVVELFCVALQEGFFFGVAAQRFHIFTQSALVIHDAVDVLLAVFHFLFKVLHDGFLRCDFLQSRGHL
jgi:hypothetical protein